MSFATETSPSIGLSRSVASSYPRTFVPGFAERVRLPLLLVLTVAGLILYSRATDPSVGRLAVLAGIGVAGAVSRVIIYNFYNFFGIFWILFLTIPRATLLSFRLRREHSGLTANRRLPTNETEWPERRPDVGFIGGRL